MLAQCGIVCRGSLFSSAASVERKKRMSDSRAKCRPYFIRTEACVNPVDLATQRILFFIPREKEAERRQKTELIEDPLYVVHRKRYDLFVFSDCPVDHRGMVGSHYGLGEQHNGRTNCKD